MCKAVAYFLVLFLFAVRTFQLFFFLTVCFSPCNLRFDAATGWVSRYKHRGRDSIELFWWIGNPPRPHRWVDHSMLVSGKDVEIFNLRSAVFTLSLMIKWSSIHNLCTMYFLWRGSGRKKIWMKGLISWSDTKFPFFFVLKEMYRQV